MSRFRLELLVFLAGLASVCWIGAGYLGSNPLAACVTLLIAACYLAGAFELYRYRAASATLARALAGTSSAPATLDTWLAQLHPSLRGAARARIEGTRAALPGPALTPYLVGLLVLLGMLGTLLGMIVTLRGTGAALASATDLDAIRAALAAPIKGLGFAFGTSVAGVSSSAALGLLSALCRRERAETAQQLDAAAATDLRVYSQSHQREASLQLLQQQSRLMPALVERLDAMMAALDERHAALSAQQLAGQQAFHDTTAAAYAGLAASVAQTLRENVAASARAADAVLQPAVQATLAGLARESSALRETVEHAVQRHLDALTAQFETSAGHVTSQWTHTLNEQRVAHDALVRHQRETFDQYAVRAGQHAAELLEGISAHLAAHADTLSAGWHAALDRQADLGAQFAANQQHTLSAAAEALERQAATLQHQLQQAHATLQHTLTAGDAQRLAAWSERLESVAAQLGRTWEAAGAQAASHQRTVCDALAQAAADISEHTAAHARGTLSELSQLVQAAAAAPQAAAEVIAEMRQQLSDSMARDTVVLEERNRLLATLDTLLTAVNHASSQQRAVLDDLLDGSSALLQRVGAQFGEHIEAASGRLDAAAAQITGSAVEVASLGDAFGTAVQTYGAANDKLSAHLQQLEDALDKSLARSDEQLAYYVAQAKEVVDLSLLSQKQIVEELRRLADDRRVTGAEPA